MLDHRQVVAGNHIPACSFRGNHIDGVGDVEFGFRGAVRSSCSENFSDEFCFQAKAEEGVGAYSPFLWKIKSESSPLLPGDHQYSNLSPPTRLQVIAEGRKQLMEMIQSMPENSYELSLKDIVDEQQYTRTENKEGAVVLDGRNFQLETEEQIIKNHKKKKKKSSNIKPGGQISRSTSMESGNFMIKIFFPRCLSNSKRKTSTTNCSSKVSPRTSFEISEKDNDCKGQWIKRTIVAGENISNGKNCGSSKSNSSSTSRRGSNYLSPGCWPFLQTKKSKATRQTGCIF